MSEWAKVRLGEVAKMMRGKAVTRSSIAPGNIPVILGGREPAYYCNVSNHTGPCFIVSRSGASAGYVSYWDEPIFVTDGFLFDADSKSDTQFLYYSLKARQESLIMSQNGTGIPHVRGEDLKNIELEFPTAAERNRIAAILSNYDSAIDNARRQIALLEEAAMRLYREWFGDGKGERKPLGEFIEITTSGSWGTDTKTVKTPNEVVCIRGADFEEIHGRSLGKQIRRFISDKHLVERSLKDGDLVVEMSGGSPTQSTGRVVSISDMLLARYGVPVLATNFCKVVRPKSGYSRFLYLAWRDLYVSRIMFNYEVGTTGIKNFDYDLFVSDVEITNPLPKLTQFNGLVDGMFSSMDMLGSLVQDLTEARDRLLPKLMSGEIEV